MTCTSILLAAALGLAAPTPVVAETRAGTPQDAGRAGGVRLTRVRVSTGVELQVAERGPSDGEPVLFLHGYTDSWFSFARILDNLPAHVRAIAPSQRGHGDSERPACCYTVADFAADAVALLDALGIERATVVGHSMGSFIAQRVAIERPGRVNRLVLIGSGTTIRTPPVLEFSEAVRTLTDPIAPAFVREFQESTAARPLPPAFLEAVVAESQKLPARVWRDVLAGLLASDAVNPLERIQARTLIIWGEKDAFWTRSEQDRLVRAISGARLVAYPDIGHAPHWEDPDRVAADVRAFLSSPLALSGPEGAAREPPRRLAASDQRGMKRPGGTR